MSLGCVEDWSRRPAPCPGRALAQCGEPPGDQVVLGQPADTASDPPQPKPSTFTPLLGERRESLRQQSGRFPPLVSERSDHRADPLRLCEQLAPESQQVEETNLHPSRSTAAPQSIRSARRRCAWRFRCRRDIRQCHGGSASCCERPACSRLRGSRDQQGSERYQADTEPPRRAGPTR